MHSLQVVDIDPPVSDTEPTESVVSGKAGLFIGISKVSCLPCPWTHSSHLFFLYLGWK